jgi:hypothetical protein
MRRCHYCKKIAWPWNSEETHLPTMAGFYLIRVCHNCKPIWEKKEKDRLRRFRASLLPPDNGYMPQSAKDWIENG